MALCADYHHKAHRYIARYFTLIGKARAQGKLYDCIEYPAGVPDEGNFFITGELYEIKDAAEFLEAMQVLDEYEGSYENRGEPALFRRELVNVMRDTEAGLAWIYWYNRPVAGKKWIASGDILKTDL